jgi:hypothetical protein
MSSCRAERPKAKALGYLDARISCGGGGLITATTKATQRQQQRQEQRQGNGKNKDDSNDQGRDNDKGKMRGFFASLRMTRIYLTQTSACVFAITIF